MLRIGAGIRAMAEYSGPMSPELERLVAERISSEQQALRIQFSLCFAASLFALAAASLMWGAIKSKRNRVRGMRNRRRREDNAPESPVGPFAL